MCILFRSSNEAKALYVTVLKMIHGYQYMGMASCPLLKTYETISRSNAVDHYSFYLRQVRQLNTKGATSIFLVSK
jgi:hypothetical protein